MRIDPANQPADHLRVKLCTVCGVTCGPGRRGTTHTRQSNRSRQGALAWLGTPSSTWSEADVPEVKAEVLHAIYERIVVTGRTIVSIRLTPSA